MSIEILGPKKYDFQYLTTATLYLCNIEVTSLLVEAISDEDATLTIQSPNEINTIDIQVKGSTEDVTIDILCEWLLHFGERQAEQNLLSKLVEQPTRRALIISSGRCDDDTRKFITKLGNVSNSKQESKFNTKKFIAAIKSFAGKFKNTELREKRKTFCLTLAKKFEDDNNILNTVLQQVAIWEMATEDQLKEFACRVLSTKYLIPTTETINVLNLLVNEVKGARDRRGDVVGDLSRILSDKSGHAMLGNEKHISSDNDELLLEQLKTKHVLLLTGKSLCGKTNMAKFLAMELQKEGVKAGIGTDAESARFF